MGISSRGRRRRRLLLVAIPLAVALFLVISAVLARVFSADGAERTAITLLIRDEAAGNQAGMISRIKGCAGNAACRARVAYNAVALRRPGAVSILQLSPSTGFSLSGTVGTARVAWKVSGSLPIVQCVRVRRAGSAFTGLSIELLELSKRINSGADCPASF